MYDEKASSLFFVACRAFGKAGCAQFEAELEKRGVNTRDEAIAKLLLDADTDGPCASGSRIGR